MKRLHPLRDLGWWIADYTYALQWQVRAFLNRTDSKSFRSGTKPALVVLPGIYETWKFMQPLIEEMHGRGHPVHVIAALGRNRWPVPRAAQHVTDYIEAHDLRDVILVAHSKGGLVGKQVMMDEEQAPRIRAMVAAASPFQGSIYGRLMLVPSLRAFSPSAPVIRALGRDLVPNERITSIYGLFDPHIPSGSELPGARNVLLETGGHFRILAHPRIPAEISRVSEAASPTAGNDEAPPSGS